jgi:hypothetical protein
MATHIVRLGSILRTADVFRLKQIFIAIERTMGYYILKLLFHTKPNLHSMTSFQTKSLISKTRGNRLQVAQHLLESDPPR